MRAAWYTSFGPAEEALIIGELKTPEPEPGEAVSYTHLTLPTIYSV